MAEKQIRQNISHSRQLLVPFRMPFSTFPDVADDMTTARPSTAGRGWTRVPASCDPGRNRAVQHE